MRVSLSVCVASRWLWIEDRPWQEGRCLGTGGDSHVGGLMPESMAAPGLCGASVCVPFHCGLPLASCACLPPGARGGKLQGSAVSRRCHAGSPYLAFICICVRLSHSAGVSLHASYFLEDAPSFIFGCIDCFRHPGLFYWTCPRTCQQNLWPCTCLPILKPACRGSLCLPDLLMLLSCGRAHYNVSQTAPAPEGSGLDAVHPHWRAH